MNCAGTVKEVQTLSTGLIRLQTEGTDLDSRAYICKTDGSWGDINASTCNAWLSHAQLALATGKEINLSYTTTEYNSCAELPVNSLSIPPYLVSVK